MKEELIMQIIQAALGLAVTILTVVLIPKAVQLINSRIQNEQLKTVVDDVANSASIVIKYLEQTTVKQMKKDGRWNSETQKQVLEEAVQLVMDRLANKTMRILENEIFDVEELITSYIEAAIYDDNQAKQKEGK